MIISTLVFLACFYVVTKFVVGAMRVKAGTTTPRAFARDTQAELRTQAYAARAASAKRVAQAARHIDRVASRYAK